MQAADYKLDANASILCVQKHHLCIHIDALARIPCVQNHDLCVLDAMMRSGYNAESCFPGRLAHVYFHGIVDCRTSFNF